MDSPRKQDDLSLSHVLLYHFSDLDVEYMDYEPFILEKYYVDSCVSLDDIQPSLVVKILHDVSGDHEAPSGQSDKEWVAQTIKHFFLLKLEQEIEKIINSAIRLDSENEN